MARAAVPEALQHASTCGASALTCLPLPPHHTNAPGRANIVEVAVSVPDLSTLVAAVQVRPRVASTHGFRRRWQLACACTHYHAWLGSCCLASCEHICSVHVLKMSSRDG